MTNEMTNEEAIAIIRKEYLCVDRDCDIERSCGKCDLAMPNKEPILKAYNMAIKALETIPKYKDAYNKGWEDGAKATYEHLKMCEEEQELCNDVITFKGDVLDAISRIGLLKSGTKEVQAVAECLRAVEALPPVNPQEKTGHWIAHTDGGIWIKYYECSKCGKVHDTQSDYCEKCGIRMESEG